MLDWHVQNDNWECRLCGVSCQLAQLGDRPVVMSMQCRFHRSRRRLFVLRCRQIQSNIGICRLRKLRGRQVLRRNSFDDLHKLRSRQVFWYGRKCCLHRLRSRQVQGTNTGNSYVRWLKLRLRLHSVFGCDIGHHLRRYRRLRKLSKLLVAPCRVAGR